MRGMIIQSLIGALNMQASPDSLVSWPMAILLIQVAGILCAIEAIYWSRSSHGAIAWGISLLMFPAGAIPLYCIFGRWRFKGYRDLAAQFAEVHKERIAVAGKELAESAVGHLHHTGDCPAVLEQLAEASFVSGNSLKLLVDGHSTFGEILSAIRQAREYILFQAYIIRDDGLGGKLKRALLERARAGVAVYFLYDEVGCSSLPESYLEGLRNSPVHVSSFDTTRGFINKLQLNFRNHRKIVVVDGETAFVGGHNVGDEYLGKDVRFGHWRDTHIQIKGPAVIPIQAAFYSDWLWAARQKPALRWRTSPEKDDKKVLVMASGPADSIQRCTLFFLELINYSQKRLWIASPYFVPDDAIINALQLAALRGVDVRIMLPEKPDHLLVWLAAHSFLSDIRDLNARVFYYKRGFLHQKVMLVDDCLSAIGTANLDTRSFRLNFEITVVIADREFNGQVAGMLEHDFADSQEERRKFEDLPLSRRVGSKFASLFSPIL